MTIPLYELPSLLHAWHKRFTLLRPETPCLIAPWLPFVLALCLCVVVFALARQARTLLWAPVCGLIGTAPLLLAALVCPAVYFPLTYPEEERYQNGSYDSSGAWTALTLTEPDVTEYFPPFAQYCAAGTLALCLIAWLWQRLYRGKRKAQAMRQRLNL